MAWEGGEEKVKSVVIQWGEDIGGERRKKAPVAKEEEKGKSGLHTHKKIAGSCRGRGRLYL